MFFIKVLIDNLNINYIKQGNGRNVLILPGWGTTIATYTTLINSISTYATVYCLDMPGFGESDEPRKIWNLDDYINFVIKFIESQNLKEFDVIGHSNGGRIIIKLISQEQLEFKIGKIILIGSAGIVHEPKLNVKCRIKLFKIAKKILNLKPIKAIFPNALDNLKNKFGSEDYKNASPILRSSMVNLINTDLKECMPNIKVPTLLIWGENDTATPIADAKIMEKLIPDAGLVKVEGASHYVFLEAPGYVNLVISTFLNGGNK